MVGTKNSGRKKEFIKPKTVIFYMEETKYNKLMEVMKNDGYKVMSRYLNAIIDKVLA